MEYENSKFSFQNLKMGNLSDMNDLYKFQDVYFLYEIVENRLKVMHKMHGFNHRRFNLAVALSGCIKRNLSKVIIVLPINSEFLQLLEKNFTGDFSSINIKLGFDGDILLPNLLQTDYSKMNIDQSFQP